MVVFYLIGKEFKQMFRNIILPVVFVILPIALINGIPRIATQEIKGLKAVAVDNDRSSTSGKVIRKIDASAYIDLAAMAGNYSEAMEMIQKGEADVIVDFPADFEKNIARGEKAEIMLSANAVNGTKGGMAQNYIAQIVSDFFSPVRTGIEPRFLYNSSLDYKLYMIPALLGLILILIVGFLPALNIVSEKEKGTIEQINVTPIRKREFILSKIIPYVIVGLFMVLEGLMAAKGIFGFFPKGSLLTMLAVVIVFCMLVSSFGLVISNYSNTLQQAALTMFFFLVIFILMSGLLTPIQSMPVWAQRITLLNPLRYFVEAMRAVYIKGSSVAELSVQLTALAAYSALMWTWAILSYRKNS